MDYCLVLLLLSFCFEPQLVLLQSCNITLCGRHAPEMEAC